MASGDSQFTYSGYSSVGKQVRGKIVASSKEEASELLFARGVTITSVVAGGGLLSLEVGGKPKMKDVTMFSRQLAVVLRSGTNLTRALSLIADVTPNEVLAGVLRTVHHDLSTGSTFSQATGKHEQVFGRFFVEMLRSGEATGEVSSVLEEVAGQLETNLRMAASIKKALTYPVIVLVVAIAGTGFLLGWLVPQFVDILDQLGNELPPVTVAVIGISEAVQRHWYWMVLGMGVLVWLFMRWKSTPKGSVKFDQMMLKAPIVGVIVQKSSLATFCGALAFCLRSGVKLTEGLEVTSRLVGSAPLRDVLWDARSKIQEGAMFGKSLAAHEPLIPKMMHGMIQVGEESGNMVDTLVSVSQFYEMEVDEATGSLAAALEPIMMVVMGLIVGSIVGAVFAPLLGSLSNIGGV